MMWLLVLVVCQCYGAEAPALRLMPLAGLGEDVRRERVARPARARKPNLKGTRRGACGLDFAVLVKGSLVDVEAPWSLELPRQRGKSPGV